MNRLLLVFSFLFISHGAFAQPSTGTDPVARQEIFQLRNTVNSLEQKIAKLSESGAALFLFGAFCALWAQNTGRNAWLWFFLGLFFSVITVTVLLSKNSGDRRRGEPEGLSRSAFKIH